MLPVFGPFLGTIVKNTKHKQVAPGIDLIFCNQSTNPSIHIWVPEMRFDKMYIFGALIELACPCMVSS